MKIDSVGWAMAQQNHTARQSDDYYWQHQLELQQSDLTFNRVAHDINHNTAPDNKPILEPIEPPAIDMNVTPPFSHLSMLMEKCEPDSITLSKPNMEQLITHIETITTQPGNGSKADMTKQPDNKSSTLQKSLLTPTPPSVFKHYHLYLNENQVELTLNTTYLSKQQISQLQKFIHQWLSQKGYTLKQLMLNGEHQ